MLGKRTVIGIIFTVVLLLPNITRADDFLRCDEFENACFLDSPLYCSDNVTGTFRAGLTTISEDPPVSGIGFEALFNGKSPKQNPVLVVANGHITPSREGNEVKLTSLTCEDNPEAKGQRCRGQLTAVDARALESHLDFEQTVLNVILRKGRQDACIGKLLNDELLRNEEVERLFCSFKPNPGRETVSGSGFFDPKGYGDAGLGEAHFHLRLEGLPEDEPIRACVQLGDNRWYRVLSFQAWGSDQTDSTIYGKLSSDAEQKLSEQPLYYSFDFYRSLQQLAGSFTAQLERSLSTINRSVSSSSASSERSSSNSSRKESRKRKRRRGRRRNQASEFAVLAAKKKVSHDSPIAWLAFEPRAGGEILIAPNCRGDVLGRAYGKVVCGKNCNQFHRPEDQQTQLASRACLEQRDLFSLLIVRVREGEVPGGSYTLCINGATPFSDSLIVPAGSEQYGQLQLTDVRRIADSNPGFSFFDGGLESISSLTLSSDAACQDAAQVLLSADLGS